ncbi:hypothetical protein [Pleomorphomonas sp. PLEO]|uniref:hypothetical protein n=1 Tax=Pleomorphomonas sp. PLEO TaxID=3239306 RepID=UPI00351DD280
MSLRGIGTEGKPGWDPFQPETVIANVFAVVEQADRWGMSPFSLLLCSAIIYGKLGFEGKVINGVLESNYGIKLSWTFSGAEGTDTRAIEMVGTNPLTGEILLNHKGEPLAVKGTVADWKTTGNNTPWKPPTYDKMLVNRGSREWGRMHKASAILGIYSFDELESIGNEARALSAKDKTKSLADRFAPGDGARSGGFSPSNIKQLEDARGSQQLAGAMDQERPKETVAAGKGKPAEQQQGEQQERQSEATDKKVEPDVERLPRATHDDFSAALLRVSKPEAINKMADEFWPTNGGWPPTSVADKKLAVQIAKAHTNRTEGKISLEDMKVHVAELIAESYGEGL